MVRKIRKKTLKKTEPILKASKKFGEFIGVSAVVGEKITRKFAKKARKVIGTTAQVISEKSKEIVKTTKEVVPEVVKEIRRGVKTGAKTILEVIVIYSLLVDNLINNSLISAFTIRFLQFKW